MLQGDGYVRPQDLIPYLGLSRAKIYRLINQGEIPAVRLGSSWIIPVEGLRRRLEGGLKTAEKDMEVTR